MVEAEEPPKKFQQFRWMKQAPPKETLWESFERFAQMERDARGGSLWYVLIGHEVVPAREVFPTGNVVLQAGYWFQHADRTVRVTRFGKHARDRVSTVFLGLDHSFGRLYAREAHAPLVFETMIFGGPFDGWQERYSTWEEAVAGHQEAVRLVRAAMQHPARAKRRPLKLTERRGR